MRISDWSSDVCSSDLDVVRTEATIIDSRFDFDYWRALPDTRLLWGGGVSTRRNDPPALSQFMMNKLLAVFPQLAGIRAETAWGEIGRASCRERVCKYV